MSSRASFTMCQKLILTGSLSSLYRLLQTNSLRLYFNFLQKSIIIHRGSKAHPVGYTEGGLSELKGACSALLQSLEPSTTAPHSSAPQTFGGLFYKKRVATIFGLGKFLPAPFLYPSSPNTNSREIFQGCPTRKNVRTYAMQEKINFSTGTGVFERILARVLVPINAIIGQVPFVLRKEMHMNYTPKSRNCPFESCFLSKTEFGLEFTANIPNAKNNDKVLYFILQPIILP